eukprot:14305815-Heterocapsa_arctica.AAC.1
MRSASPCPFTCPKRSASEFQPAIHSGSCIHSGMPANGWWGTASPGKGRSKNGGRVQQAEAEL